MLSRSLEPASRRPGFFRLHGRGSGRYFRRPMWQRKQSVFLGLAALLCLATWLFPVRTYQVGDEPILLMTHGIYMSSGTPITDAALPVPFHILFSVLAGVFIVAIFLYGNRTRQIRVVRSAWLIVVAIAVLQFVSGNSLRAYLVKTSQVETSYGISFFLPLLVIVLAFLAERAIRKDEELVRSADRLR